MIPQKPEAEKTGLEKSPAKLPANLESTTPDPAEKESEENITTDRPMGAAEPIISAAEGEPFTGVPEEQIPGPAAFAFEGGPAASDLTQELLNLPPDQLVLNLLIKSQYIERFWLRTEEAQKRINDEVDQLALANSLMNKLQQARNYILAGKEYIEEGERLLSEVEHRLNFIQRVRKVARNTAPWLLVYELVWLALLVAGFVAFLPFTPIFTLRAGAATIQLDQLIYSMIWGGVGGVVGALFALWRHVSDQQDFDRQYTLWYITSPILGLPLGAFIFLVIQAGFFTLTAGSVDGQTITSALVIYVLAWVGGFKQNVIFDITKRILDVFRVQPEREREEAEKPEAGFTPPTLKPPAG